MKSKADGKAGADFESTSSLRARLERVVDDIRYSVWSEACEKK